MVDQAYLEFFQLQRPPFSIAPDPHFLYLSGQHREALAHLVWGLGTDGGFVVLTGEVGTGKTTLSRCLLEQIPDDTDVAYVINPRLTAAELLATICEELGDAPVEESVSDKRLVDRINRLLLDAHARGRRTVLVIDEAQLLSREVLEQIRLLTNLETSERKLLQVVLIGQPELDVMLSRADLRQLAQRVTARYHLKPLSAADLAACVGHRLELAGCRRNPFTRGALASLHRTSGGIPRLANLIADRALLGAFVRDEERIGRAVVRQAAREVAGTANRATWPAALTAAGLLVALTLGGGWLATEHGALPGLTSTPPPQPAPEIPAAPDPAAPLPETDTTAGTVITQSDPGISSEPAAREATDTDSPAVALVWDMEQHGAHPSLQQVLDRWHVPLELGATDEPCTELRAVGLGCLELDTDWEELLALDLPAVLHLAPADTALALVGVREQQVAIATPDGTEWLPRQSVVEYWPGGSATLIWQLPPGYRRPLLRGSRGEAVRWLRRHLAETGHQASGRADEYDAALESAVREFQAASGLQVDGIAGPLTWIRLQHMSGIGTGVGIPSLVAMEER